MIAIDTSVAVAAFADWHESHRAAAAVVADGPAMPAHVAIETYSVLTRLPAPHRVPGALAADYLDRMFPSRSRLVPRAATVRALPRLAFEAGVSGGAIYDALVALTARDAGATLVTRDRRALATYAALGVDVATA